MKDKYVLLNTLISTKFMRFFIILNERVSQQNIYIIASFIHIFHLSIIIDKVDICVTSITIYKPGMETDTEPVQRGFETECSHMRPSLSKFVKM